MRPLLLCLLCLVLLAAPANTLPLRAQSITNSGSLGGDQSATDEARIDSLLDAMTLEQRVGQLFMVTLHGEILTYEDADFLRARQPGGVALFSDNIVSPESVTALTNSFQQTMRDAGALPLMTAIDQEGGVVTRLTAERGFTAFPAPILYTAAGNAMTTRVGAAVAGQLAAVGISMNLAPVADLDTYRENPIIFRRTFGNDPALSGEAVAAFIMGSQAAGVMATAKHFPGHGETREDSHGTLPRLDLDLERLRTVELVPFRGAIDAGVSAIMVAHIWFPALDPDQPLPASLSRNAITGLLRDELGYDGLVLTDALDMNSVDLNFPFAQAAVMAIAAGADMLPLGPGTGLDTANEAIDAVLTAVRAGSLPEARVNEAVRRILRAKLAYGLLDWAPLPVEGATARVNAPAGEALIDELFRAGATIAHDPGDLVPIPADKSVTVIFLGTRYQIQAECGQYRPDIRWFAVSDAPNEQEIAYAQSAAQASDIAIVWTQDAVREVAQAALVNALPQDRTVAVALWSPYDWELYPAVGAFVALYSPLRPAVPAGCAALFGAMPAQGRLAVGMSAGGRALAAGSQQ